MKNTGGVKLNMAINWNVPLALREISLVAKIIVHVILDLIALKRCGSSLVAKFALPWNAQIQLYCNFSGLWMYGVSQILFAAIFGLRLWWLVSSGQQQRPLRLDAWRIENINIRICVREGILLGEGGGKNLPWK